MGVGERRIQWQRKFGSTNLWFEFAISSRLEGDWDTTSWQGTIPFSIVLFFGCSNLCVISADLLNVCFLFLSRVVGFV